ncbi:programmed cell death protein 2-like [Gymnodraco acuticeps]|uniref:Programmed cell death protein 2-like n=1 Tax=Gymnodraco acuticeps TaxID=8218 RepID=A0A6P8VHJ8_GYMAC|nr:programmed cell death protein 2-like [Gymnodraco acuticeps]
MEVVLLGLSDGDLDPERYRASFITNKLGGKPDWMLPDPERQAPRCARCGAPLAHVVQVYCPVHICPPHHRTLYLFACTGCSSSSETWRVIRSQRPEETSCRKAPIQEAPAASEWCDTAEDWGEEEEEEEEESGGGRKESQVQEEEAAPQEEAAGEMHVSLGLQDLTLGDDVPEENVPELRSFFISVAEESELCGEEDELHHAQKLLREYERREGVSAGQMEDEDGGGGEEKYEKTKARHGDAVFSRFMKKISLCPQQILRYSRRGKPLFISQPPENMQVPRCGSCGGERTFEMQLMPALVSLLRGRKRREKEEEEEVEVEFGTVLVFTCNNSCWTEDSGSTVEEICFVQPDPDQKLFK